MKTIAYLNDFLIYLITEKGDSEVTKNCYKKDIEEFIFFFPNLDVKQINLEIFDEYLSLLMDENLKRSSILRKISSLKTFLTYLQKKDVINISINQLETPKKEIRLPVILTDNEVNFLLTSSKENILDFTMILFDISTGLRVSELISLKYNDINLIERYVKVKGKRSKERIVPFSNECLEVLKQYLKTKKKSKSKYLFTNKKNRVLKRQEFYYIIKKYSKLAGIKKDIYPHVLRHTYASKLIENGVNIRQVQILLGHSNIETTQIYTHLTNKKIIDLYDESIKR